MHIKTMVNGNKEDNMLAFDDSLTLADYYLIITVINRRFLSDLFGPS